MQQCGLDSGAFGVEAGGDEGERGGSAVEVGDGVDVGARVEQEFGDGHDVRGSFLAVAFDAVGGDVVQERGLVTARGAGAGQVRVFAQQIFQCVEVAGDDGVDGLLEMVERGIRGATDSRCLASLGQLSNPWARAMTN